MSGISLSMGGPTGLSSRAISEPTGWDDLGRTGSIGRRIAGNYPMRPRITIASISSPPSVMLDLQLACRSSPIPISDSMLGYLST